VSHVRTWACDKPDGDGCDGSHVSALEAKLREIEVRLAVDNFHLDKHFLFRELREALVVIDALGTYPYWSVREKAGAYKAAAEKRAKGEKVGTTVCRHGTPTDSKCELCR
jgi:hypothetical protein